MPYSTRYVGGELFVKKIDHGYLGIMKFFSFLEDLGYCLSNYNLNGVWFCITAMDIFKIEIWHDGEVEVLPYSYTTRYVGGELFVK